MSILLFLTFVLFSQCYASASNETSVLLHDALVSLKSALEFLYREHKTINLDAVIGTRMVEGQFSVLLQRIELHPENWVIDTNLLRRLRELAHLAGEVSNKATPYIADLTPNYYHKIGTILNEGFWELDYPSTDISTDVEIWPYRQGESLHENESDDCLAEFFGTGLREGHTCPWLINCARDIYSPGKEIKKSDVPCDVSDECWRRMTKPLYNGYSLTHELFYLEIGQQHGCSPQMELKRLIHNQEPLVKLRETFCANILNEAALISEQGYPEDRHDLFMEQAALCGMVGFRQFFSSDWLREMLKWQNKAIGCYIGNPIRESDVEYRRTESMGIKGRSPPKWKHRRHRREERILRNGCLSHRTAVAVAGLGQYVRYIMEYMAY